MTVGAAAACLLVEIIARPELSGRRRAHIFSGNGCRRWSPRRHETQGIDAQQMMASGVPLFVWDKGGLWQDPEYAPHQVRFGPVTSMSYWDERCGVKFATIEEFRSKFDSFWHGVETGAYAPRQMIVEHFTLEQCARAYLDIAGKYDSPAE